MALATVCRGLSASAGFWNTIWIRRRWLRGRRRASAGSAAPSSRSSPPASGCSPAITRAIVVLPLPDSPTSATQPPRASRNDTSLAATTV